MIAASCGGDCDVGGLRVRGDGSDRGGGDGGGGGGLSARMTSGVSSGALFEE